MRGMIGAQWTRRRPDRCVEDARDGATLVARCCHNKLWSEGALLGSSADSACRRCIDGACATSARTTDQADLLASHIFLCRAGHTLGDWDEGVAEAITADPQRHINALVEAGVLRLMLGGEVKDPTVATYQLVQPHVHDWRVKACELTPDEVLFDWRCDGCPEKASTRSRPMPPPYGMPA